MNTNSFNFFMLIGISICLFGQCKSSQETKLSSDTNPEDAAAPLIIRVLLAEGHIGKYIVSTYGDYGPRDVKPASRSENWFRVRFNQPGNKEALLTRLETDPNITQVEELSTQEGIKIDSGKSQKRAKSAPIRK